MEKREKSGFEVKTEVEEIIANIDGVIASLWLLDNVFELDSTELSDLGKKQLIANHGIIASVHHLVETQLSEMAKQIETIKLEKDLDPAADEKAN